MSATKLIEWLLQEQPLSKIPQAKIHTPLPSEGPSAAEVIVEILLDNAPLSEATVHRPKRGSVWVASLTGAGGGQTWRSTGLSDRAQALLVARRWEAQARAERARLGRTRRKAVLRVRHSEPGTGAGLTQEEVAQLMRISVRAVRNIEKRAIRKLFNHPVLRQLWRDYSAGDLDEQQLRLTAAEIDALFALTRNPEGRQVIQKVLRLTQR